MTTTFLSWVATYAIHSTVLIAATWVICRFVPRLALATQEALWKLALFGGIATATVQIGAGLGSPWGAIELPEVMRAEAAPTSVPIAGEPSAPKVLRHRAGELTITATHAAVAPPVVATSTPVPRSGGAWPWVVLAAVAGGAVLGLVRLAIAARRLRKQLLGRRDVVEDPVLETFLGLCSKAGLGKRVRLSASPALSSPVALRREVCIPERAIEGLTPRQQEGMLAHELAHVVRRDPIWVIVAASVEAVFFFQPLNHLVRRKIEEVSEYQCDDWAARHTGTGVHLAKCLAEVASWIEREPTAPLAANMATPRSPIVRRITRLLDERRRKVAEFAPAWRFGAGIALLVAVAWLTPGVSAATPAPRPTGLLRDPAAMPALASAMVVEDLPGDGRSDRARVRITSAGESIDVDVAAPRRPVAPPQPPVPPPPPAEPPSSLRIIVHGDVDFGPWPMWSPWRGFLGVEVHGLGEVDAWAEAFERDMERFELEMEAHGDAFERIAEGFDDERDALEAAFEAQREAAEARAEAERDALIDAAEARREAAEAAREAAIEAFERDRDAAVRAAERARIDAARAAGTMPVGLIEL